MPDDPEQHACWVCGETSTAPWKDRSIDRALEPSDLQITDARYGVTLGLRRCDACGFIFAEGDDMRELVALYSGLEDDAYEQSLDTRRLQMQWLLRTVRKHHADARTLLDIGAGAGLLVREAQDAGFEAAGVEPSHALVEAGRRVNEVELHQGIFPHPALAGRRFDVISLVDVIEHVADPVGLLAACREALAPGGLLLVVTPDVRSLPARLLRQRWWHFRLAHVGYFDRRTLGTALERAGLEGSTWVRARWFFRAHYLVERLAQYLPVSAIGRAVRKLPGGDWLLNRVVPLNLYDSWVVLARSAASQVSVVRKAA